MPMPCRGGSMGIDIGPGAGGACPPPSARDIGVGEPDGIRAEAANADRLAYPSMLGLGVTSEIPSDIPKPYPAPYSILVLPTGVPSPSPRDDGLVLSSVVSGALPISD